VVAAIVTVLLATAIPSTYALLTWNKNDYRVVYIPGYVLVWGFLGGCAAVLSEILYRSAPTRKDAVAPPPFSLLVICRPVIGAVVGAAAYLLAKAGVLVLASAPSRSAADGATTTGVNINPEFFAGVAFLAGFADRSTGAFFRSVTRSWSRKSSDESERDDTT
jgi:hypothetical protein